MTIRETGKRIGLIVLLVWLTVFVPTSAQAEEDAQNPAGYTVESVIPDNQVDKEKTYYHLKMVPEQAQTIQVKVISMQKEPVKVKLAVHDAVSSEVGAIDYAAEKPKLDKSLKDPITSFVKIKGDQKEITVQNFEEKIVEYEIQMPKEAYAGVKLGSLRFLREGEDNKENQSGLIPEYARVIALMLTEDEDTFNHGAELHLKNVQLSLSNGRKVIAANIQNDQPKVLQKMTINGQVKEKGKSEVLAKHEMEDFSVAPNSNFNFEIPLGVERFLPGTYVFTGEAKGDGKTWKWEEEFTVGEKQAEKINEETVFKLQVPKWVPWVALGLVVALIGLGIFLSYRQKQWQHQANERK